MEKEGNMSKNEMIEEYFKIEKEQSEKYYSFIRTLLVSSTGFLTAIVLFTDLNLMNSDNAIFRDITIFSISLGILLSAILLYGEIVVLKNLRSKIGKHINTLQVRNNNESTPIQSSRSKIYKVIEIFCFSSYVVFIISLAWFGFTLVGNKIKQKRAFILFKNERLFTQELNETTERDFNL
jgi:hypothetical protein